MRWDRRILAGILSSAILFGKISAWGILIDFSVDPMSPPSPSSLTLTIKAGILGSSTDGTSVSGTATLDLEPGRAPFSMARLVDLDLVLDDGMKFKLGLFNAITASTEPGDLRFFLVDPGPAASVVGGTFTQTDNVLESSGTIHTNIEGPIDLATLGQVSVDLENLSLSQQDDTITLRSPFFIVEETMIDNVPLIGSVPVTMTLSGTLVATGDAIPSTGDMVWDGNNSAAGLPGDGSSWSSPLNWNRNGVADREFISGYDVSFRSGSTVSTVNLQEDRAVNSLDFQSGYTLEGGTLEVATGDVTVGAGVVATIGANVVGGAGTLTKSGTGTLNMNGTTSGMLVDAGRLSGEGFVGSLIVGRGARIAPGASTAVSQVKGQVDQFAGAQTGSIANRPWSVPEPSGWGLVVLGVLMCGGWRRCRSS